MKYIYPILILCCSLSFSGCSDNDYIQIDSLSADGDEFFCNQKVKVWMCLNSSDLWNTDYEWTCEGGTFTQPQGLNEMTWKAPSVPGTYTITCKASIGGASETRTREMHVSSYYFEKFEKSSHSLTIQSSTTTSLKKESNGNQYLEAKVNTAAEHTRYVRRSFGDETLRTPFSTRMKLGFVSNMPTTQRIAVTGKNTEGMLEHRWNLSQDASNNGSYISQIRLRWYPGSVTDGYPTWDDAGVPTEYNVEVRVQHTSSLGVNTVYIERYNLNTMNTFANGVYKNVSLSVDEAENILVYMEGTEILKSTLLKTARTTKACEGIMRINQWDFYFLNGNNGMNIPVMYIDDCYASTTEVLK